MTRLRSELLRALRTSPLETIRGLVAYDRALQQASHLLKRHGLDEALARLDAAPPSDPAASAAILIMRLGEAFPRQQRTCLDRALTRYAFLKSAGSTPVFVIGIDPKLTAHHEPEALGHAWVEVQDKAWPHEDVTAYRASYRHPADRSLTPAQPIVPLSRPEIQ